MLRIKPISNDVFKYEGENITVLGEGSIWELYLGTPLKVYATSDHGKMVWE